MRLLLDLRLLDDGGRGARADGRRQLALVRVDDRVGQLVLLRTARRPSRWSSSAARASSTCVVVEDADREQEALLVVGRDLLGSQRVCANVSSLHLLLVVGERDVARLFDGSPHRRTPTGSRGPRPRTCRVIRCGVRRGMKQMSPGPRSRRRSPTTWVPRPLTHHHDLVGVRVVVVLVRRPVRRRSTGRRRSASRRSRARRPSGRRCGRTGPPGALRGVVSARRTRGAAVAAGVGLGEERRDRLAAVSCGASSGMEWPASGSSTSRAFGSARGELAAVLGQRAIVEPADEDERRMADLGEAAGERLRGGDRAALARRSRRGRSRAAGRGTRRAIAGSRCERRLGERRVLRPDLVEPAVEVPSRSIRSADASMRGARFERSASVPIRTSAPHAVPAARARA